MPFSEIAIDQIRSLGESKLIKQISDWLGPVTPAYPQGMGDDCALLPASKDLMVVTTDSLTFGQHFDASVSAKQAGAKLIKRNLSDIAAMGAQPSHAVLALLCGPDLSYSWLEGFFTGIRDCCENYQVKIVGGDVSGLPAGQFSAVLTLMGTVSETRLRKGATCYDYIYVTGTLGGSILSKHYTFEPRLAEGQWLANNQSCVSLMDLTDGIAKDLKLLLPDSSAAAINLEAIPVSADGDMLSKRSGLDPLEHAFCDGEDYELLFTVTKDADLKEFESKWASAFPNVRLSRVGQIIPSSETSKPYLNAATNEVLPWTSGFEHLTD